MANQQKMNLRTLLSPLLIDSTTIGERNQWDSDSQRTLTTKARINVIDWIHPLIMPSCPRGLFFAFPLVKKRLSPAQIDVSRLSYCLKGFCCIVVKYSIFPPAMASFLVNSPTQGPSERQRRFIARLAFLACLSRLSSDTV